MESDKTAKKSISLPETLLKKAESRADEAFGGNVSGYIQRLIETDLANTDAQTPGRMLLALCNYARKDLVPELEKAIGSQLSASVPQFNDYLFMSILLDSVVVFLKTRTPAEVYSGPALVSELELTELYIATRTLSPKLHVVASKFLERFAQTSRLIDTLEEITLDKMEARLAKEKKGNAEAGEQDRADRPLQTKLNPIQGEDAARGFDDNAKHLRDKQSRKGSKQA